MIPNTEVIDPGSERVPKIPDHEPLGPIGRGSYGEVWLARNVLGQYRAVKLIYRNRFGDQRPFEREFEGIQRFEPISRSHPSQLSILHVGKNDAAGCFYYVMELADDASAENGQSSATPENAAPQKEHHSQLSDPHSYIPRTLRHDLEKHRRLPVSECVQIGLSLTTALGHLHANGLVHRDIKPSNVIFVNGVPKLGDIGLITESGDTQSIVGTEGYISPEGPGTPQADIFSLGKVLYEISTGMDRRRFLELPEELRAWPDRNGLFEFNEILLKACESDPAKRYQSAESMNDDLSLLARGRSLRERRVSRERWILAKRFLLPLVSIALLTFAGIKWWPAVRIERPLSSNVQALNHYNEAVYNLRSESLDKLQKAYAHLAEAVKQDPKFEAAYLKMLEVYYVFLGDKFPPRYDQVANEQWLADKLNELNPHSASYYTVDSLVQFHRLRFDQAIQEATRAVKLDPKIMRAHFLYAWYVMLIQGDVVTARAEQIKAEALDPLDLPTQAILGDAFYMERNFTNAIKELQRVIALEDRTTYPHYRLAKAYEATKQYNKAIDEMEKFESLQAKDPESTKRRYERQRADVRGGPNTWWEGLLKEAEQDTTPILYQKARLYARLGRDEEAIHCLEQAYKEQSGDLWELLLDDCWDVLRDHRGFKDLMRKLGLGKKANP